jgi:hypothetical protein
VRIRRPPGRPLRQTIFPQGPRGYRRPPPHPPPIKPTISPTSAAPANARGGHARNEIPILAAPHIAPEYGRGGDTDSPSPCADRGRYGVTSVIQLLPSPLTGEGVGGGETTTLLPPILTFPHKGGKGPVPTLVNSPSRRGQGEGKVEAWGAPASSMPPYAEVKTAVDQSLARGIRPYPWPLSYRSRSRRLHVY